MQLKLAVVCDEARQRPDGKVDLLGVFDELAAPGFPAVQEKLTVVFIVEWEADEIGRQPLRADLVHDDDTKVLTIQGHAEVGGHGARLLSRLVMPIENVIFPHAGAYHFELVAGGHSVRACSLHLVEHPSD